MEDDELLFEIKDHKKRSRTTFESLVNKKRLDDDEMDSFFNDFS
jgi:hypothetical protein